MYAHCLADPSTSFVSTLMSLCEVLGWTAVGGPLAVTTLQQHLQRPLHGSVPDSAKFSRH